MLVLIVSKDIVNMSFIYCTYDTIPIVIKVYVKLSVNVKKSNLGNMYKRKYLILIVLIVLVLFVYPYNYINKYITSFEIFGIFLFSILHERCNLRFKNENSRRKITESIEV